jgi:hypothetical protein
MEQVKSMVPPAPFDLSVRRKGQFSRDVILTQSSSRDSQTLSCKIAVDFLTGALLPVLIIAAAAGFDDLSMLPDSGFVVGDRGGVRVKSVALLLLFGAGPSVRPRRRLSLSPPRAGLGLLDCGAGGDDGNSDLVVVVVEGVLIPDKRDVGSLFFVVSAVLRGITFLGIEGSGAFLGGGSALAFACLTAAALALLSLLRSSVFFKRLNRRLVISFVLAFWPSTGSSFGSSLSSKVISVSSSSSSITRLPFFACLAAVSSSLALRLLPPTSFSSSLLVIVVSVPLLFLRTLLFLALCFVAREYC